MQAWKRFVILVSSVCVFALFSFVPVHADTGLDWFNTFLIQSGFTVTGGGYTGTFSGGHLTALSSGKVSSSGTLGAGTDTSNLSLGFLSITPYDSAQKFTLDGYVENNTNKTNKIYLYNNNLPKYKTDTAPIKGSISNSSRSISSTSTISMPNYSDPDRLISLKPDEIKKWQGTSNKSLFSLLNYSITKDNYFIFYGNFPSDFKFNINYDNLGLNSSTPQIVKLPTGFQVYCFTIPASKSGMPIPNGFSIEGSFTGDYWFCPSFVGTSADIPSSYASLFGISRKDLNDIYNLMQSSDSQSDINSLQSQKSINDQVQSDFKSYSQFEDSQGQSFTNDMNAVNFESSGLASNGNFLNSASFVRDRFEDLTNDTPFYSLIVFSLTLGIGLTVIGRLRNR